MGYTSYNPKVASNNADVAKKMEQYFEKKYSNKKTSEVGQAANENAASAKTYTSRGTKITEYGDTGLGKDSFLQLLVAQMTNMDPTQDQDSTAYVTQMAQFASIEQMNNLNTTMTGYSVRNLLGQTAIVNMADEKGNYIEGTVLGAYQKSGKYYLSILNSADGKTYDNIDSNKVTAVVSNSNMPQSISAINTQFLAASSLKDQRVVYAELNEDGKSVKSIVKGIATGAKMDSDGVKVTIKVLDDNLEETSEVKTVPYTDLYKMGDLTDEEMNVTAEDINKILQGNSADKKEETENESDEDETVEDEN